MAAPAQLGLYLAVLRKHLVLLGVTTALVVAAGVVYVVRQPNVYRSSATLVIEAPARAAAGGVEYQDLLFADQDELQTQVLLLTENTELAREAIAGLAAKGVDVAAGGYTEESLPSRVKVEPIPGTRAWRFSLTGTDPRTLPEAVNSYAQVFQRWSEERSARRSEQTEEALLSSVAGAETALERLQKEQRELVSSHKDLNLAGGENAAAATLNALRGQMPAPDDEKDRAVAARAAIVAALASAGVDVTEGAGEAVLTARGGGTVEERLLDDEHVAGLPVVRENEVVRQLADEERDARERDRKLASDNFKPSHAERVAAQDQAKTAHARRGRAVADVVRGRVAELSAAAARVDRMVARMTELEDEKRRTNELLIAHAELSRAIQVATRDVERAQDKLRGFQQALQRDPDTSGRAARATRRIVLETPAATYEKIAPKVPLVIGLTAFAAIAAGLGLVLLFEYLDDTIKSREDFDRYVGLPFLGFIPRIDGADAERPDLAANAKTGSAIAEAFRAVRTSILFSRSDKPVRSILVTSAGPGEGKTTVAVNLAITLAKHKAPVLLVDADLRRPRVAKALGVENRTGLTNFLVGDASLDQVVQPTSIEGLFVVTSGPIPPNPAELLHGERLAELVRKGLERFDRIVIDSPPVIAVSDARVVARCADGLYLVISMGKTSWRLIQRSIESLSTIGFGAHGAILNNLSAPTGRYGYYYDRDYEYGKSYYVQPTSAPDA
jgi:capsular exopolysaccharide synthesis family protein